MGKSAILKKIHNAAKNYQRYLAGNYICEEDMLKRPLSKITMDLLKELSII